MSAHFLQVLWVPSWGSVPDPHWLCIVRAWSLPYEAPGTRGPRECSLRHQRHIGQVENPCLPGAGPMQKHAGASAQGSRLHTETSWQTCIRRRTAWSQKNVGKQAADPMQQLHCFSTLPVLEDYIWLWDSHMLKNIEKLKNQGRLFKSWRKCMRFSRKNYGSQVPAGRQNSWS